MNHLVPPHGGKLRPLLVQDQKQLSAARKEAAGLPAINLSSREVSDLIMLGTGAFSPLDGFVGRADYDRILGGMRLADGTLWPIPITLAASRRRPRA